MLTALIIDDQEISRVFLCNLIKEHCREVEVVAMAADVEEAVNAIAMHKPDVVFLDVELSEGDGFEVLKKVARTDFEVIFTTAYDQYAVQAIKVSAIDFLQKPVDENELKQAVEKARQKIEQKQKLSKAEEKEPVRIPIPVAKGVEYISVNEIIRCESEHYYTNIFLKNGKKHLISKTLKEFEKQLAPHNFIRIHQSHLINLAHLEKFVNGSKNYVILSDQSEVPVSRRKKEDLLKRIS